MQTSGRCSIGAHDVVVVGSGPNGLVAAALLAQAGRRVLVLEAADRIGGGLRSEELTLPGYVHDVCSSVHPLALASPAFRELALQHEGLRFAHPPIAIAHPRGGAGAGNDGGADAALVLRDVEETARGFGVDAANWRRFVGTFASAGEDLTDSLLKFFVIPKAPARLAVFGALGVMPAKLIGRALFRDAKTRALFAGVAGHAILDLASLTTAGYALLLAALAHSRGWPVAVGGSQRIADALAARLRAHGGEIETGHRVESLRELPHDATIVLDLTPREVLRIAAEELPSAYQCRLDRFRYGPGVFKVDWALDGPVPWRDERLGGAGTVHLGGSAPEIEHAEREVARGRHPRRPYVIFVQATVADPSRAPDGKHTGWAYCHVPNGSTRDMTAEIEAQVERFAPGFRGRIIGRHVMGPRAMQAHNANYVGGDIVGGAANLAQMVARPVLRLHPWATPNPRIFLCSASTPPGGGVHGMGGWHAAQLVLRRR